MATANGKIDIKYNNRWTGYKNFPDITNMSISDLAPGSQNVIIHDGEKIEPRPGMDYFGAQGTIGFNVNPYWTLANRIHSKYDEFVGKQGTKIPVRVFYSGTLAQGDVMEAWLPIYVAGVPTTNKRWYPITALAPTIPIVSTHRYYWGEWFDEALGVKQPELIFTFGGNTIGDWSGGYANIVQVTPTTIQTDTVWEAKGFIWAPEGINTIVVNGVEYIVTAGFGTNTLTVASTVGINVDDIAFQSVYFNDTLSGATTYDVCSVINNQIYYVDWKQRNVYISWNRNQISRVGDTGYRGTSGLNDGVFSGTYTGTVTGLYEASIDSVTPPIDIETQTFTGTGSGTSNWVTGGYTGGTGHHIYKMVIVADTVLTFFGGVTPAFTTGELIVGNTSGAFLRVIDLSGAGASYYELISGNPVIGETYTGQSSGTTSVVTVGIVYQNEAFVFKDGVQLTGLTGMLPSGGLQFAIIGNQITTIAQLDGLQFTTAQVGGDSVGDYYTLDIQHTPASPDTFSWTFNGAVQATGIAITGAAQLLNNGVSITFANTTGHDKGDTWFMTAYPTIIRGWSVFTYDNPNRLPGQGFTALLDSNGWTMIPQEETMYLNAQAGHYYTADIQLSADLRTETVTITRLKSEATNKVLFPYLIKYIKNQMAVISQDKTYDVLGRQKFLELPQLKSISDEVRVDFETADWEDGDVLYYKRKIYFNVPRTGLIFVYDEYKKYWHTPMKFGRRISLLSIIDDKLIGHSYERNESYELFTGLNDLGLYPIATKMVMAYDSYNKRYLEKATDAIGFEGYIEGAPVINYTVNADVGGCHGQFKGRILPFICLAKDTASLGKSSLGFHGLGNNPVTVSPHFYYIKPFSQLLFYQRNIEIECNSLDQRWSLISLGTTVDFSGINNTSITDPA